MNATLTLFRKKKKRKISLGKRIKAFRKLSSITQVLLICTWFAWLPLRFLKLAWNGTGYSIRAVGRLVFAVVIMSLVLCVLAAIVTVAYVFMSVL